MKILDSIATIQTSESKKSTHVKFEIFLIYVQNQKYFLCFYQFNRIDKIGCLHLFFQQIRMETCIPSFSK